MFYNLFEKFHKDDLRESPCLLRVTLCNLTILIIILFFNQSNIYSQTYLSNLNVTANDPIYTTYAAPMSRSNYKIDQGYSLKFYDPEKGVNFESAKSGDLCIGFKMNGIVRYQLKDYYKEPVITATYSDIVKYYYYPFKNIRVECCFAVYSSKYIICEYKIINESNDIGDITLYPYTYIPNFKVNALSYSPAANSFTYLFTKSRDEWMKDHNIPLVEKLQSVYMFSNTPDSYGTYEFLNDKNPDTSLVLEKSFHKRLLNNMVNDQISVMAFQKNINLKQGGQKEFRIIREIDNADLESGKLIDESRMLLDVNLEQIIKDDEKIYSKIPSLNLKNKNDELIYWSAFSLMRQCMMPPEGECDYNYYVFSREPKWGWGYGGQVFHESLTMLAYALMDSESAMNSQRVYIERQLDNGYINYIFLCR